MDVGSIFRHSLSRAHANAQFGGSPSITAPGDLKQQSEQSIKRLESDDAVRVSLSSSGFQSNSVYQANAQVTTNAVLSNSKSDPISKSKESEKRLLEENTGESKINNSSEDTSLPGISGGKSEVVSIESFLLSSSGSLQLFA